MKFLAEATTSSATQWILPAILLVLVIGIFVLNYYKSKKNQENMKNMVDSLKVGDNVKTYSGIYGKIIEIIDTTDGKVAVLETGSEKNKGIFSIDINAVFGTDAKEPVVYDTEGNVITQEGLSIVEESATEKPKEEVKEKKSVKEKKDAEKIKRPATKKQAVKKTEEKEPEAKKAETKNKEDKEN